jgi:hypothetical protein
MKLEDQSRQLRKDLILRTEEAEQAVAAEDTTTVNNSILKLKARPGLN